MQLKFWQRKSKKGSKNGELSETSSLQRRIREDKKKTRGPTNLDRLPVYNTFADDNPAAHHNHDAMRYLGLAWEALAVAGSQRHMACLEAIGKEWFGENTFDAVIEATKEIESVNVMLQPREE